MSEKSRRSRHSSWPGGRWQLLDRDYSNQLELAAGIALRFQDEATTYFYGFHPPRVTHTLTRATRPGGHERGQEALERTIVAALVCGVLGIPGRDPVPVTLLTGSSEPGRPRC